MKYHHQHTVCTRLIRALEEDEARIIPQCAECGKTNENAKNLPMHVAKKHITTKRLKAYPATSATHSVTLVIPSTHTTEKCTNVIYPVTEHIWQDIENNPHAIDSSGKN